MLGIIVIRTLGGEGVEWADGGQRYHRPAPRTQVRETTAAGNRFVGVLAAALDCGATLAEAVTAQSPQPRSPACTSEIKSTATKGAGMRMIELDIHPSLWEVI